MNGRSSTKVNRRDQFLSVLMCVYGQDNPEHFKQALESVATQTRRPDEIVLVVDGPIPDKTKAIISELEEEYCFLKTTYLDRNVGHGEARRIGLEKCIYPFVAIMDADDISVADRFSRQLQCFEEDNDLSIVGGNIAEFTYDINCLVGIRAVPSVNEDIQRYLRSRCPMNQVTVMFKKDDVCDAGGYIDWYCDEDYYLWIRMYELGMKFRNLDETLVYVRVSERMYQRRGGLRYFYSEAKLQQYMLNKGIITRCKYLLNVFIRFFIQVVVPDRLRALLYRRFARRMVENVVNLKKVIHI